MSGTIEWLIPITIAVAAFAFGGVEMWSQAILFGLVAVMLLLTFVRSLLDQRAGFVGSAALVPVVLLVGWCLIQFVPLGPLLNVVSPATSRVRADVLGATASQAGSAISLYAYPGWLSLRLILLGAAMMFIVMQVCRSSSQIDRLLGRLVMIGAAVALLAVGQVVSWSPNIFWVGPPGRGPVATGGPFVHYSHFGQFMNLCIGLAIAAMLVRIVRSFRGESVDVGKMLDQWKRSDYLAIWLLSGFVVVGTVSVFLSGSRTASVSLLVGLGVLVAMMSRMKMLPGRGWLAAPLMLLVLAAGSFGAIHVLLGGLGRAVAGEGADTRLRMWSDSLAIIKQFPIAGTGLGTFQFVYPMFDTGTVRETATHAESEYVQILVEAGVVGLLLVISFVALVSGPAIARVRRAESSSHVAAAGLLFALTTAVVHAFADFAMHVPANILLMGVICGLLVVVPRLESRGRAARPGENSDDSQPAHDPGPIGEAAAIGSKASARLTSLAATAVACGWLVPAAWSARAGEAAWREGILIGLELESQHWDGSEAQYGQYILAHQRAVDAQPGNAEYRAQLSQARWLAVARQRDAQGRAVIKPSERGYVGEILVEAQQSRRLAPTYADLVRLQADIGLATGEPGGSENEALLYRLDRVDGRGTLAVLKQAAKTKDMQSAQRLGLRYVELTGDRKSVAAIYLDQFQSYEQASGLYWNTTDRLPEFAELLRERGQIAGAESVQTEYVQRLERETKAGRATARQFAALAEIYASQGRYQIAVESYLSALTLEYDQQAWRLACAKLMAERGNYKQAAEQANICVRLDPGWKEARVLLEDWSRRIRDEK